MARCAKAPGEAVPLSTTHRHTAQSAEAAPNQEQPRELIYRQTAPPQHAALTRARRGPFGAAVPFPLRRRAAPHAAPPQLALP
eukprot:scaffold9730_cov63-Phaeocystis_antarctica.AAC.1